MASAPDSVLTEARSWFNTDALHFRDDGGRLLGSVFAELTGAVAERLAPLMRDGQEDDVAFALAVLSGFGGKPWVYPLVRAAVARLDQDNELLNMARLVLDASPSEGVSGQFGFAELYSERKVLVQPWLDDPSEAVRMFARETIRELERRIASETRSAETTGALRRLAYDEDIDGADRR